MNVLYLLRYYPTLTETFVYREIDAIGVEAPSIQITIAAMGARADGALLTRPPRAAVWKVPRRTWTGWTRAETRGQRWLRRHQRPKDVARLPWLARRLANVDRIHVHFAGEAAEWARALHLDLGIPYTVTVHAVDLFRPRPSLRTVLDDAQAVLTVAEHHRQRLAEDGIEARVVRCGPDPMFFSGTPLPSGPLRALFVGRNVPKKGLSFLLNAWPHLDPKAHLEIISDYTGPAPRGVTVRGLRPACEVYEAIQRSNLLVLPCQRAADGDQDGIPVVLMEALASGRPVIASAVSGIPELVDETVGWLIPQRSKKGLLQAFRGATPTERAHRGARGPTQLKERKFTVEQQVKDLLASWSYTCT